MKLQPKNNLKSQVNNQYLTKIPWNLKIIRILNGDNIKNSRTKIKGSLFAIIIGLILGMIPILIASGNPILGYWLMVAGPFSETAFRRTITVISVFIILGAGVGISFKTGLFNIGATGQFLMSGMICVILGINSNFSSMPKFVVLFLLFFISMIIGALTAFIPGFLKAFFNVHEVVTTILLNWVVFFIVRWMVSLPGIVGDDGTSTLAINVNAQFSLATNSFDYIVIFIISLIMCLTLFVIFKYTKFGYVLKLNGLSLTAAKYSGINTKLNTISSLMISGAFAGVAGFIFYNSIEQVVPKLDILPTIGFEALTVTLLAFSSPIGAIFSGFFYGVIYQGRNFMQIGAGGNVVRETALLTLGVIIFMSALAVVLVRIYPIKLLTQKIWIYQSRKIKILKHKWKNEKILIKDYYDKIIQSNKKNYQDNKILYKKLKSEWVNEVNLINQKYQQHKLLILEKDHIIQQINDKYQYLIENQNLLGYKTTIKNQKIAFQEIDKKYQFLIQKELLDFQNNLQIVKQTKRQKLNDLQLKNLKKSRKQKLKKQIIKKYYNHKSQLILQWKEGE